MKRTLVWFHRNLRIDDNPALQQALKNSDQLLLLYVDSPLEEIPWQSGAASRWWLSQSLHIFQQQLDNTGMHLNIVRGNVHEIIPRLVDDYKLDSVYWQRSNEPHLSHRGKALKQQLNSRGIETQTYSDMLLLHPHQLLNQSGKPYRVFTPFYKRLRSELFNHLSVTAAPQIAVNTIALPDSLQITPQQLSPAESWHNKLAAVHLPGELSAQQTWQQFLNQRIVDYPKQRDFPAQDATSQLSAALHFGEISIRRIAAALQPLIEMGDVLESSAAETFLRQIIWREFAQYTLWFNPNTPGHCLDERFERGFWLYDDEALQRWQQGETGIAMVDAAMKQLWQTGTMHNRARMVVASFLTKNLGLHWHHGARWFWDTLVDADLANNTMGWQWVAGCGVDAAPYYRIFNPETQAKRFDPQERYLSHWLPQTRPSPMIDLATSRKAALERYQQRIR